MEFFYWYNIKLEDNNRLDFEDLLEKALILVSRKCLADFIRDKKIDLVNKYVDYLEKVPATLNIVELLLNLTPPILLNCISGCTKEYSYCSYLYVCKLKKLKQVTGAK